MIGYLRGSLLHTSPERLLIDVHGVGYEVHVPLSTYYEIEKITGDVAVGLFIYTHVREDAIELFGFHTEHEKLLFEMLISVSGIGPKLGRVILSGIAPDDLIAALATGDEARLTTISGIGKKTSQRMVLELKDRAQKLAADLPTQMRVASEDDLVLALANLGYKPAEAERAATQVRQELPGGAFPELLRASLKKLSRV
ncbi:MAG: Holliday junction branch migration protein RuvA [Thermoanaerobaculia bacterium]